MSDMQTRNGAPLNSLAPSYQKNDHETADGCLTNKNSTTISHVQASDLLNNDRKAKKP